jgi:pimeloyl-ACP methyl ester carboxylesterase
MVARPIVFVGGWLSSPGDYFRMARTFARPPYNRIIYITNFSRLAWGQVRDPNFRPVLDTLAATVELALNETGADAVDLIGHSAGGRIARAYLGHVPFQGRAYDGQRHVARLITLGTAHETYEVWVKEFAGWVNQHYPGAFYKHIEYRMVIGKSVQGRRWGNPEEILAHRSYEVSFGDGQVIGDGIIPTSCGYLEGADNLVLEGARHAPYNAPNTWYGASNVIPLWFD